MAESSSSSNCSKVRVGVRIRPLTGREEGEGGQPVVKVHHPAGQQNQQQPPSFPEIRLGERRFSYDGVFDAQVTQSDLYRSVSPPLLRSFLDGYNATIMAYGQTGSGKTFTMGSEAHTELQVSAGTGLIPRFMSDLFGELKSQSEDSADGNRSSSFTLEASFLEVYGEDVFDLLVPSRPSLPLREDANGGVVCAGLTRRSVGTAQQALEVLHQGTLHRTTAATLMNLTSSRSHAVFSITLTQTRQQKQQSATRGDTGSGSDASASSSAPAGTLATISSASSSMTSRFTFVDLAGSERMKKTGAEGERAREGIKINEGLLALGNVINALADEERLQADSKSNGAPRKVHVPYRQSKLTRLLQDALGGNSQTLFLACVSPSDTNSSETLSTLHYANRARNIRNAPTKNVDAHLHELQRLQSLVSVLERTLVQTRFGATATSCTGTDTEEENNKSSSPAIGEVQDETLLQRPDVLEYLSTLHSKAQEQQALTNAGAASRKPLALMPSNNQTGGGAVPPSPLRLGTASFPEQGSPGGNANNKSVMDNFDPALLGEVNPDEEMAILDQLLELQHRDNEFDEEQKKDVLELKEVNGELAKQENMLLQLRDSLKVYHDMKGKYEALMAEVQQLEVEKTQLAEQLENVTADPTKGCSKAIKKELNKVEQSLARARNETRKHREMYRKAELEAKKCAVLERKIHDLKSSKAKLMKKQKESAAQHREYTQAKTREIMALKKTNRNNEQRMSKLQTEVQRQKKHLDKRQEFCGKLSAKLKQTEAHLMKLLSLRQRELHRDYRTSTTTDAPSRNRVNRRTSVFGVVPAQQEQSQEPVFAPPSQALSSVQYLLNQVVSERIEVSELQSRYEERVAAYGQAMRQLVDAVKHLEQARRDDESKVDDSDGTTTTTTANADGGEVVRDLEQSVEDLELKVELVGEELESLRMQLSTVEENTATERVGSEDDDRVGTLVRDKDAPMLRSLLVETAQTLVQVQLHRNQLDRAAQRNESVRRGLENEVESVNEKVDALTKELAQAHSLRTSQQDPIETIRQLRADKDTLSSQLSTTEEEVTTVKRSESELRQGMKRLETELSVTKERLALLETTKKQHECAASAAEEVLASVQGIWQELGVPTEHRDEIRQEIENCLDDTCLRKLEEAKHLKEKKTRELQDLQLELDNMKTRLGMDSDMEDDSATSNTNGTTLLERIKAFRQLKATLEPTFASAKERADTILKQVEDLCNAIGLVDSDLAADLERLRAGTAESGSLSDDFLARCEQRLSALRVRKSEMMARNAELLKETFALVSDMNLSESQILPLVEHSRKRRSMPVPEWWSEESAAGIARAVSAPGGIVRVAGSFYNHLFLVNESLSSLVKGRRILSQTLGDLVQRSQKTLLETVDGEMDASEAYASFHETLFRLPPLSKELIHACIAEVNALLSGVEDMTQSEIEALTVVWEALDVSSSDRGTFWGEVDDAVTAMETGPGGPFDDVVQTCLVDGEEWVMGVVRDATKSYRRLETRLFKLERIHKEVERLRARQDAKSKIISLDSEVRILSAKLSEFEHKQCNKQRLLTKKTGSSNLLKEERFRKQMQQKFTSKLEQLAKLLKTWSEAENCAFDTNLLSEEVRLLLLDSPDNMDVLVEKRTEFMHLRTVKTGKRGTNTTDGDAGQQPPRKRQATRASKAAVEGAAEAYSSSRSSQSSLPETKRETRKRPALKPPPPTKSSKAAKPTRDTTTRGRQQPSEKKRLTLPPFGHVLEQASSPPNVSKENAAK